jgi:hypothetical protein
MAYDYDLAEKQYTQANTGREDYIGWMGYGGSTMQWNHKLKIGFGYVPFNLAPLDFSNTRALKLQKIISQIAKGEPVVIEKVNEKSKYNIF